MLGGVEVKELLVLLTQNCKQIITSYYLTVILVLALSLMLSFKSF